MPGSGDGTFARAEKHLGEDYDHGLVPKDKKDHKGPWDCAEFASWLVYQEGEVIYGCSGGDLPPARQDAYTGFWQRDVREKGERISVEEAAATKGAFLLRYPPVGGEMGHIAVSDGAGGTVEARGKAYGVVRGEVAGRHWDTGILIPGFTYERGAEIAVPPPAQIYALNAPNMDARVVTLIQSALKQKGYDPGPADGSFGTATVNAVAAFQKALGVVVDGEVGPVTANALGISLDPARLIAAVAPALLAPFGGLLSPLIAVAANVLPEIIKALAGDKAGEVARKVGDAVSQAAGTSDPAAAQQRLDADPAAKRQLQLQLAELAVKQEEQRERARIEAMKAEAEAVKIVQDNQLAELRLRLDDVGAAREAATRWAAQGGLMGKGPFVVAMVVMAGFLALLAWFCIVLILPEAAKVNKDSAIYQLVNVAFGTLAAAFATVVSFFLGSSTGSRFKDATIATRDVEQSRSIEKMVETKIAATEAATPAAEGRKPARLSKPSNFQRCMDIVFLKEGGYSNHPDDNGGPTNFGITLATYRSWKGNQKLTEDDVRKLTREEAVEIYRSRYWNALRCDDLPAGVDLIIFDFGVNAGISRSAKMLQKIIGAEADGSIGNATLGAIPSMKPRDIIAEMTKRKLEFYKGLDDWPVFGKGWTNRALAVEQSAIAMVGT